MNVSLRRLDEVCSITMGQAPPGDTYNTLGEGLPLIAGAGDFDGDRPEAKKFTSSASKICAAGDIVLGIRASIGAKVWADKQYCLGRGVAGLRPRPDLDARYLWHWLGNSSTALAAKGRGATFLQVNRNDIGEMTIALPPMEGQRRIAAILDQADALRAKRMGALDMLTALTGSCLTDLLNTSSTELRSLGEISVFYGGASLPVGEAFAGQSDGYLLMKVSDMNSPGNGRDICATAAWSSSPGARSATCPGPAIVLPKRGGAIGTNKKRIITRPTVLDPNLMGIMPNDAADLEFLFAWFKSFDLSSITSGSSVPQLNKQDLAPLTVPVPPRQQRLAFAERVAGIRSLEDGFRNHLAAADEAFGTLQARAFGAGL